MKQDTKAENASRAAIAVSLVSVLLPWSAWAQDVEIAPLLGWTTAGAIDRTAPEIGALEIKGGFTWGAQIDYFLGSNLGVGISWAQQRTGFRLTTPSGSATLFDLTAGQVHANLTYQFGGDGARVRPYVLGGLGATFFRSDNLESETRFSFGLGGGLKVFFSESLGLKFQGKYNPTRLGDDDSQDFCDPFGFCQGGLNQLEFAGGVFFRF